MKSKKFLLVALIIIALALIATISITKSLSAKKQFILIGVDGMQYDHFAKMLVAGKLPNYQKLINGNGLGNDGISTSAQITGHTDTSTAPGNAELFTGLPSSVTTITDNSCDKKIPEGLTIFERLRANNSNIKLGLVYGKKTCYVPESILSNAKQAVSWWFDRTNYPQKQYISNAYADSRSVSIKALEFINANKEKSFFLAMYYGAPDAAGHTYGENSKEYDEALVNTDSALGILIDQIQQNKMNVTIILTSDHGWNEGTTGHSLNASDTQIIPMISNDASIVTPTSAKQQCSVAPTIYKYFNLKKSLYADVTNAGCFPMF